VIIEASERACSRSRDRRQRIGRDSGEKLVRQREAKRRADDGDEAHQSERRDSRREITPLLPERG